MDPIDEIVSERDKARERGDLNANVCFLATVSEDGGGAVRAISLRDVDHRGFGLLLNGLSVKWTELESGRGFELLIYWPTGFSAVPGQGSDGADGRRGDASVLELQEPRVQVAGDVLPDL